jgi:hypothetical protein
VARDGTFRAAADLVCSRPLTGVIEKDEALRAAFAPDSAVLSPNYSDAALTCFVKARGHLEAGAPTLASWAREAGAEKQTAVLRYLIVGDLGQQLADQLKRPWLDARRKTSAWRALPKDEQNEVERKFLRGCQLQIPLAAMVPEVEPVKLEMDPEAAFILVSDWWRRDGHQWIAKYEETTYPNGFPGALPWPGDDEWDAATQPSAQARWLLLFIHAALVPLGFDRIGRDQGFSRFLLSKNILNVSYECR